jgi:hypothetical protein
MKIPAMSMLKKKARKRRSGSVGVLTFSPMSMALDRGPPERRLPEQEREREEGKKGGHGNDGGGGRKRRFKQAEPAINAH